MTSLRKYSGYRTASVCFALPRHSRIYMRACLLSLPPILPFRVTLAQAAPGNHFLSLLAELLYSETHLIARLEKNGIWLAPQTNAGRRARYQQVSRVHGDEPTHIGDQLTQGEDHSSCVPGLHASAIEIQEHLEVLRIADFIRRYQPRSHRSECVATLAFVPLGAAFHLKRALGNVVGKHVSRDAIERLFLAHVSGRAAENNPQFDLPIAFQRVFGQHDIVIGTAQAADGLGEHRGFRRDR